jgi:hypothetical protein
MTQDQKEKAWKAHMTLCRLLADFYGVKIRVTGVRWKLADGAVVWRYTPERTGQKLWSRP